ncbi:hypothetical protein GUJ93_ZPchr0015g6969 [Zizania palustris]|uniref:Uncharacterized protein n=1 Tax=Zizania palustris TaxID=103762 RepID=A0A8J5THJ0_ZIZPA|nr:hypothetical protein GUJ93_ZPchr0015g6969 [Zizania palustris]
MASRPDPAIGGARAARSDLRAPSPGPAHRAFELRPSRRGPTRRRESRTRPDPAAGGMRSLDPAVAAGCSAAGEKPCGVGRRSQRGRHGWRGREGR